MNGRALRTLGVPVAIAVGSVSALVAVACSSDATTPKTNVTQDDAGTGGDSGVVGGSVCPGSEAVPVLPAGEFPPKDCRLVETPQCELGPASDCPIDTAKCGNVDTCLPMANNTDKTKLDFRIRRLNVMAPASLAAATIQSIVVTKNIDLANAECGDKGFGAFNWLVRVDTTANTLTTGGAPPTSDPFGLGYCFYSGQPTGVAAPIQPVTVNLNKSADGVYSADSAPILNVPVFLNGKIDSIVILPISDATVHSFAISADKNCIGTFNKNGVLSGCADDPTSCEKWNTNGSLGGFITLEAADNVMIDAPPESLCVLLTGSTKDDKNKCKRGTDGKIPFKGDYCSTDKKPGSCQDSYWLAATFAASAVKIDDSGTNPLCPTTPTGGNTDAGPVTDTDSGTDSGVGALVQH